MTYAPDAVYEQGWRDALATAVTHDRLCYRSHDQPLDVDPFCQCTALRACEERVTAAAVQRVEAMPHALECVTRDANYSRPCNCLRADALDALKGDQP